MTPEYEAIIERLKKVIGHCSRSCDCDLTESARAAYAEVLAALEKPTPAMLAAVYHEETDGSPALAALSNTKAWQAMLRAAPRE